MWLDWAPWPKSRRFGPFYRLVTKLWDFPLQAQTGQQCLAAGERLAMTQAHQQAHQQADHQNRSGSDRRQVERRRFPRSEIELTDRRIGERRAGEERREQD